MPRDLRPTRQEARRGDARKGSVYLCESRRENEILDREGVHSRSRTASYTLVPCRSSAAAAAYEWRNIREKGCRHHTAAVCGVGDTGRGQQHTVCARSTAASALPPAPISGDPFFLFFFFSIKLILGFRVLSLTLMSVRSQTVAPWSSFLAFSSYLSGEVHHSAGTTNTPSQIQKRAESSVRGHSPARDATELAIRLQTSGRQKNVLRIPAAARWTTSRSSSPDVVTDARGEPSAESICNLQSVYAVQRMEGQRDSSLIVIAHAP